MVFYTNTPIWRFTQNPIDWPGGVCKTLVYSAFYRGIFVHPTPTQGEKEQGTYGKGTWA